MPKLKLSLEDKKLIKRYLIWCYKTTKEDLERIDRKFTQLVVDSFVMKQLKSDPASSRYLNKIKEFEIYMNNKQREADKQKFLADKTAMNPEYLYLKDRLSAIKKAIEKFLGKKEFGVIERLYQEEMTKRILEAREH